MFFTSMLLLLLAVMSFVVVESKSFTGSHYINGKQVEEEADSPEKALSQVLASFATPIYKNGVRQLGLEAIRDIIVNSLKLSLVPDESSAVNLTMKRQALREMFEKQHGDRFPSAHTNEPLLRSSFNGDYIKNISISAILHASLCTRKDRWTCIYCHISIYMTHHVKCFSVPCACRDLLS